MPRLPADAFEQFLSLGPTRSYSRLAAALGVSKRSITARAGKERWQERLAGIATEARRTTDARAIEDLRAIDERHLKTARAVLARGLEALRNMPLTSAAAAVKAVDTAVKMERAILGTDKKPESKGVSWASIVADLDRQAERVRAEQAKPPEPIVPPVLAPRVFGEN